MKGRRKNSEESHSNVVILRTSKIRAVVFLCLLVTANLIAYSNSLDASWHFDDLGSIANNPDIQLKELSLKSLHSAAFTQIAGIRPISYLTFALNYYFSGLNVESYHQVNLLIHVLNSLLVFFLIFLTLQLCRNDIQLSHLQSFSFAVACLWATSPLQTQSVTYIIQRMNLLATFFSLLSLVLYLRWRTQHSGMKSWPLLLGSGLCVLLAFGSKENSTILPMLFITYEVFFFKLIEKLRSRFRMALFLCLMLVGFVVLLGTLYKIPRRVLEGYAHRDFTLNERLLTQPRVITFYLSQLLLPLPSRLALHHEIEKSHSLFAPITTLACFFLLSSLLALIFWGRKRYPLLSFFGLWFFITLLIESSVFPLELAFEHRVYMPSIGFFVILLYPVFLIPWTSRKQLKLTGPLVLTALLITASTALTFERNKVWHYEVSLWEDNRDKYPQSFRVQNNLGTAYMDNGQTELAEKAFREALRLSPGYAGARINLALMSLNQGKLNEAVQYIQGINLEGPKLPDVYFIMGVIYARQGDLAKAEEFYRKAIYTRRGYSEAYFNLGLVFLRTKEYGTAKTCFADFLKNWRGEPENPYVLEAQRHLREIE